MTLRSQVLSGLLWFGGVRLVSQVFTWLVTIVVIRLLNPGDYGLLAMATVFVSFLGMLAPALGEALIQAQAVDETRLRRILGVVILVNCTLFVLQFSAAPAVASFFAEDRLVPIIRVLGLNYLLGIFTTIPISLFTRRLDFRLQSLVDLGGAVCASATTLMLAYAGYGVWALVLGNLVANALKTLAINVIAPFRRWPEFSFKGMRDLLVFGGQSTAARVLWFLYSQADIFIAGKLLGKELLGFYSVSMHLASLPVQKISNILDQIAFPAFARTQHDPGAVTQYLLKALRVLTFLSVPVLWGISSIAPEIVAVLLGSKWQAAVVPLQILPLVMPLNMISPFMNTAFQGIGRTGIVFMNVLTACLVMPAAFWIGVHWGLLGLCFAWVLAFPLVIIANMWRMLPLVGLRIRDVWFAVAPTVLSGAGMYAAVASARHFAADALGASLLMGLLVGVGAATYATLAWFANRKVVEEIAELFKLEQLLGKLRRSKP